MMTPGDIGLVHDGKSFVARGIALFMRDYARQIHYEGSHIYHHAFTVIEDDGQLMIAEAVGMGYRISTPEQAYSPEEWANNVDMYTWIEPYTRAEQLSVSDYAEKISFKITRYQFINFVYQMIKIATRGTWIGTPTLSRMYCSKAAALCANSQRYTFVNPDACNPMDIACSLDLKPYKL